jgi:hypothetical protein
MLDLFNYVYTGKFEGDVSEDLRAAIMKWEVYTLLPVLKARDCDHATVLNMLIFPYLG